MALSASQMEWEPEIPGGWPTTPRSNRKRTASAAGLKEVPAMTARGTLSALSMNQFSNPSSLEKFAMSLMTAFAITFNLFVAGSLMTCKAARDYVRGASQYRQVVEIRRFTSDGFESVKRRTTGIVRCHDPTPQEVTRTRSQVGGSSQKTARSGPRGLPRNSGDSPQYRDYPSDVSSILNNTNAPPSYNETYNTALEMKNRSEPEVGNAAQPVADSRASSAYLEIHDNFLNRQYISQPRLNIQAQSELKSSYHPLQEGKTLGHDTLSRISAQPGAAAVAALKPQLIPGLDIPYVARKSKSLHAIDYSKALDLTRPWLQPENKTQPLNARAQKFKKATQIDRLPPKTMSTTYKSPPRSHSDDGFRATSLRTIYAPNIQRSIMKPMKITHNQEKTYMAKSAINTSEEMINSHSESREAPKSKHVRIALDPRNGLPKENVVKFSRLSYCGDWEPSSPWDSERVSHTELNLNGQLDALKDNISGSLVPPGTPIRVWTGRFLESNTPEAVLEHSLEPNWIFAPPHTNAEEPCPIYGTTAAALDYFPCTPAAADSTAQRPVTNSSNVEGVAAQNPQLTPNAANTARQSSTFETSDRSATTSPYYRIVERVINGLKTAAFLSPSPPRNSNVEVTRLESPKHLVQEATDTSFEMTDAPPLMDSSSSVSILDMPSIIDVEAIHDVGESHYGVGGPSTTSSRPPNGALKDSTETGGANSNPKSTGDVPEIASSNVVAGDISKQDDIKNFGLVVPATESQGGLSTLGGDVFLELAMSELGVSDKVSQKLQKSRAAKEAARVKKQAEEAAAAAKARAEAEEAERNSRFHRRLPNQKLVQPLSKAWEAKINQAMTQEGENPTLVTTSNGTSLTRRDLMTVLGDRQWLNDEIINGYIDWVVDYANKKAGKSVNATPRVVAQNSFFYAKLSTDGPSSISRWMRRKKAAGAKLLEVETVLIPVNNASHWTLIVVSPKARTIEYLDSFGGAGYKMIANTKAWLKVELGTLWNEKEWRVLDTESASQDNGYDCGVFVTTNAECVVGGVRTSSYSGEDMTAQRRRIAGVLLDRGFGGAFIPAEEL